MTEPAAPSLDDLLASKNPAWLWDGARSRIVWANEAGTAWFGAETLFDLIEYIFDENEASVAEIKSVASTLARGNSREIDLQFSAALRAGPISCQCYIHALADGRAGLLIAAVDQGLSQDKLSVNLQSLALHGLPLPICVIEGCQRILFANSAMQQLFGQQSNIDFARELIESAHKKGLISAVKTASTLLGERDLRIIVRPLENNGRLADSRFLLLAEDVTERRALERSLLDAVAQNEPRSVDTQNEPALPTSQSSEVNECAEDLPSINNDVAQTLSHLKNEIESQTVPVEQTSTTSTKTTQETSKPVRGKNQDNFAVPEIVSSTLNNLPQPLVLIDKAGKLLFANDIAVELMGVESWQEIGEVTTLSDALHALEGEDGRISLFTGRDETIDLDVIISVFPWRNGPVYQATLSQAVDDGENADNRRSGDNARQAKKKDEISPAALLASEQAPQISQAPGTIECSPSESELRAILDTATDGIVTLNAIGNICSFSAGAEAMFGYRSDEVVGKPFSDMLKDNSQKIMADYLQALSGSGLASVFNDGREVEAIVKQGGHVSLFLTIGKLETEQSRLGIEHEGSAAFCVVVRDITQWKKTETDLRISKEKAEKSNAKKSLFLANISHELRTPLNAIMGFSEVMRSQRFGDIENKKYLGYANDIHASGQHLLSLINDLLDLSKIDAGKLELNFTSVNLNEIITEALHSLQDQANDQKIELASSSDHELPNVVADLRSMKQILLNLLSNAVKFTKKGGQVKISTQLDEKGRLHLIVKDNGRGMNKDQLKLALEPFQQIKSGNETAMAGTGLGLPLTKALVEANRAKFKISSKPKKGTRVEIVFPTPRVLAE